MSKGILIFAFNNEKVDYEKIANANKEKYYMPQTIH